MFSVYVCYAQVCTSSLKRMCDNDLICRSYTSHFGHCCYLRNSSSTKSIVLHHQVSTVAQNGQTKQWLWRQLRQVVVDLQPWNLKPINHKHFKITWLRSGFSVEWSRLVDFLTEKNTVFLKFGQIWKSRLVLMNYGMWHPIILKKSPRFPAFPACLPLWYQATMIMDGLMEDFTLISTIYQSKRKTQIFINNTDN